MKIFENGSSAYMIDCFKVTSKMAIWWASFERFVCFGGIT
jgi:hypothetical protein